jgi:hypothetical protein
LDHNEQKIKELAAAYNGAIDVVTHNHERLCQITSCDSALDLRGILRERGILRLEEYLRKAKFGNKITTNITEAE